MAFRSSRAGAIFAAAAAAALVVGILLWLYHPITPRSILGWTLLFVIGIPTWLLLEWLGERVLSARFFSRMGRTARIALAVPVLILFLIFAAYIVQLGQTVIAGV